MLLNSHIVVVVFLTDTRDAQQMGAGAWITSFVVMATVIVGLLVVVLVLIKKTRKFA